MPTFVLLMNLTDQGIRDIKNTPARIDAAVKAWEGMGGTMSAFCMTMGAYDYVAVGEAPSDEIAAAFAMSLGKAGNVTTTTLKGFSRDEVARITASVK